MLLLNAFSLNMLAQTPATVRIDEITVKAARAALADGLESAVGHADTAAVMSDVLGLPVPVNRTTVGIQSGQDAIVGQYVGPRLAEGTTKLPQGASIMWFRVRVSY